MKALIHDGRVVQLADQDFEVHPSLSWVEVPPGLDVTTAWEWDGMSFIAPPPPPPDVPPTAVVTMRQGRLALLQAGLLDTAEAAIAAMEGVDGRAAQIEWEYAQELRRDHPLVVSLGSMLGLTAAQLDELFVLAGGL